jgi:hypothetical protein
MGAVILEVDEQELWSAVFGSGWESFGCHWHEVEWLEGDWDKVGKVRLVAIDEHTEETTEAVITIDTLLRALPIANKQVYMDLFDFEEYDSICGDAILQVCVLGKVIYG